MKRDYVLADAPATPVCETCQELCPSLRRLRG